MNDYAFASLVTHNASLRVLIAATGVEYLVERLSPTERRQLGCGKLIWTSPGAAVYGDALGDISLIPITVTDVRDCPAT